MFTKLRLIVIAVLVVANTGCNLPLFEKPPVASTPDTGLGDSTRCLDGVEAVFERFIDGTAAPAEVQATWYCVGSAIDFFEKSTRGREEDRYSAKALANFFETYFLREGVKVSDTLLTEIFRLKRLIVGGDIVSITRDEMKKLSAFSRKLGDISARVTPYMKIFAMKWKVSGYGKLEDDVQFFEAANLELQNAARELGAMIAANGVGYDIDNLVVLFREISHLYSGNWDWISDLEEMMPLIKKLKGTLTGGIDSNVSSDEWRRVTLMAARGYVQYLRYFYFIQKSEGINGGAELVYITHSADDLFSFLGDMVDEKPEKVLTRAELLEIFVRLEAIFPKFRMSEKLFDEIMQIKKLVFGGSLDNWKKEDFDNARSKVQAFRTLTEKILSFYDVYSLKWDSNELNYDEAQNYYAASETNLIEFGRRLGEIMETDYDLKRFGDLADEFERLYPPSEREDRDADKPTFREIVAQYLPIGISAKNIIFTDQTSVISKVQWPEMLSLAAKGYARFMYFKYFVGIKNTSLFAGDGLTSVDRFARESLKFIDDLIERKPANPVKSIQFTELDSLFKALVQGKVLPGNISLETLQKLVRVIFQKMLIDPEKRLMGLPPNGITKDATTVLRGEFEVWFENQNLIALLYRDLPADAGKTKEEWLSDLERLTETPGITELKLLFKTRLPLTLDSKDRVILDSKKVPVYNRTTANYDNLIRALVRLVIRSYAMDLSRVRTYKGITEEEANALFHDVKSLVVELEILDPGNDAFASSRFRDANLFTPNANGNTLMEYNEAMDLFLMIWSGIKVDGVLAQDLDRHCDIDKEGKKPWEFTIEVPCVLNRYATTFRDGFEAMPEFAQFLGDLSASEFDQTVTNLLKAAGYVPNPNGGKRAYLSDVQLFPHISQYVETLMQVYDVDKNGYMNTYEALNAFPRFKTLLAKVAKTDNEKILQAAFAWVLVHGKVPESKLEMAGVLKLAYLTKKDKWGVWANRQRVAQILGVIADTMKDDKDNENRRRPPP